MEFFSVVPSDGGRKELVPMNYVSSRPDLKDKVMHGTTTIATVCQDGVVLGADTRVTAGYFIAHKKGRKIFEITPRIAVSIAGVVADAQAIIDSLKYNVKLYQYRNKEKMDVRSAARLLSHILHQNRLYPLITELLVAGMDGDDFSLYRLDPFGSLIKDDYAGTGSGSSIAIGVLENEYEKEITTDTGKKLVAKSLVAAMQRDIASGNEFDMMVITKDGIRELDEEEKDSLAKRGMGVKT
jgi:proteasome beta subunit